MPELNEADVAGEPRIPTPAPEEPAWERFLVIQQTLDIEVKFREQAILGTSTILVSPLSDDVDWVHIDARQCDIDLENVTVDGTKTEAIYSDPYRLLTAPPNWLITPKQHEILSRRIQDLTPSRLPDAPVVDRDRKGCVPAHGALRVRLRPDSQSSSGAPRRPIVLKTRDSNLSVTGAAPGGPDASDESKAFKICIPFRTTKVRDGLQFVGVEDGDSRYPHVYTRHSIEPGVASCIFPCVDDPGSRVPWKISIKFPRTLEDVYEPLFGWPPSTQGDGPRSLKRKADEMVRGSEAKLSDEDKLLEMTVICSGSLIGETVDLDNERKKIMHFEIANSVGAQHVGFAVGPFEHVELWSECRTEEMDDKLQANAAKIHGYCLPRRRDEVLHTCSPVVMATDYFVLHFGQYPFDSYKMCFVDDMLPDTATACSMSLCSTRLLYPEDIIDTEIDATRTLVHTIASQFVGVHIVANRPSDNWLLVGMQWYMTDIFMKELCGNNHYRFQQKTMADRLVEIDVDRPSLHDLGSHLHVGEFEMDFMALKAPLLLFILDQRMKKIPGNTGVQRILSKMISSANINDGDAKETTISTETFVKACEKQAQVRCDNFLKQWVKGSGCPRLFIKQKFNKKNTSVEMGIYQTQADRLKPGPDGAMAKRRLQKADFFREVRELQEESNGLYAKDVQAHFTGPLSIQIHEADGRPYEHLVEIMENQINGAEFKITYYTKYKRLKKKRRQKEVAGAGAAAARADGGGGGGGGDEGRGEDVAYYSCFGDVLQSEYEKNGWGLAEWADDEQTRMNNESYEWIGVDTDFEWICEKKTDMPFYMYQAQLQQDRDVVAQQDALVALSRGWVHPMASTIMARTLMDKRYFYGLRIMAARELPKQGIREMNMLGLAHLVLSYRYLFCYEVTSPTDADAAGEGSGGSQGRESGNKNNNTQGSSQTASAASAPPTGEDGPGEAAPTKPKELWAPHPNDFTDKSAYFVQCEIPAAIGRVREQSKRCPKSAREVILELLVFNDNSENSYSDQFFIAKLLEALTTSVITDVDEHARELVYTLRAGDEGDREFKQFIERVIEEIDRYRKMDEWTASYHNVWTTTALACKQRLMKARIIPVAPLEFVQYLQDGNSDFVRIKAFEALVDLGFLLKPVVLRLFLAVLGDDPSPFVRDRLFKIFCQGIAAIAFGEAKKSEKPAAAIAAAEGGDADGGDDAGLIVEAGDVITEERRADETRKVDLTAALGALREELQGNKELLSGIWRATQSSHLGLAELRNLLALCAAIYEPEDSLQLTLRYPRAWSVARDDGPQLPGKMLMNFTSKFRTEPRSKLQPPQPAQAPEADVVRPAESKKIKLHSRLSMSGPSANGSSNVTAILPRPPSISLASPAATADSISVRPVQASIAAAVSATPPSAPQTPPPGTVPAFAAPKPAIETRPRPSKKRESEAGDEGERPRKIAKTGSREPPPPHSHSQPTPPQQQQHQQKKKKMVTLKVNYDKLSEHVRNGLASSTSSPKPKSATPGAAAEGTIVAAPVRRRVVASSSPSPAPASPRGKMPEQASARASPASFPPTSVPTPATALPHAEKSDGITKVRKPLPSAAPQGPTAQPPPSSAPLPQTQAPRTIGPIRIKLKPRTQDASPP